MLDNMRLYGQEQEELPFCERCGEEVSIGYKEAILIDGDYYCCETCFIDTFVKELGGIYV